MAHYAYKECCYDIDYPKFKELVAKFDAAIGHECDHDANYDGDYWLIAAMWINELRETTESQAKRIAELEAITKIECGLHDCLVMPREDDQGPLFYQPANSTLVLAKLRDYAIIPRAKYREQEAEVAALRTERDALKAQQYKPAEITSEQWDNACAGLGSKFR